MDTRELETELRATLDDGRLSRAEKQALTEILDGAALDAPKLAQLRARAFVLARERTRDPRALEALAWVEDLVKLLAQREPRATVATARAFFSPGEACLHAILAELARCRHGADICVFTITDDRIATALVEMHGRGVKVRVLTDNDKQYDGGSDIDRLRRSGIPVKVDETEHHMHHKFAVLDGVRLVNGSYNWTRSAAAYNEENLIVTSDSELVRAFARQFQKMWDALGG
ncbi:MAG TPA: phospholipase D-like domain-containing protein [Polyangiaceae bacterium]|nr:phospholipase D-like domain-containing protein [Polyangiaceae bacterium]